MQSFEKPGDVSPNGEEVVPKFSTYGILLGLALEIQSKNARGFIIPQTFPTLVACGFPIGGSF